MSEHTTHTASIKRLERSPSNRMVAGVASGLGRYFDINPAVFRLGFVVLTLLGGAGILVYLAAVLVIPVEGRDRSIAAKVLAERSERPAPLIGLGLAAVALAVLLSRGDLWPAAGAGWVLILIAGLTILWASNEGRRGRRIAIALGAIASLLAIAVVTIVVVAFAWFNVSLSDGVGDRTYQPATTGAVQPSYELGVGNLRIDLSHVSPETPVRLAAKVGIGELKIIVPTTAAVTVNAHAKAGDVYVLQRHDGGQDASLHTGTGGGLVIDATVGAGRIDVVRAG
jgi:phage shock protein PspC (stress-responsive transcriptional regulator)